MALTQRIAVASRLADADVDLESQSEKSAATAALTATVLAQVHWQRVICKFRKARLVCQVFFTVGLEARARVSTSAPLLQATADAACSESEQTSISAHASEHGIIVEEANESPVIDANSEHANIPKTVRKKTKYLSTLQASGGVEGIAKLLNTDLNTRIPDNETDIRRRRFHGHCFPPAVAKEASSRSFFGFLFWHSNDWTVILLVVAAVLYIGFGIKNNGPKTGWHVRIVVLVAAIILVLAPTMHDVWLKHLARKRRLVDLQKEEAKSVEVLRGSVSEKVSVSDVVLGDIVVLTGGCLVPADGLFIFGKDLVVNDGLEMEKNEESPFLFYGTTVSHGHGRMLVTTVGTGTVLGEAMSKSIDSDNGISRLPSQLDKLRKVTHIASLAITIPIIMVLSLGLTLGGPSHGTKPPMPEMKGRPGGSKEFMDIIQRLVVETAENMGSVKAPLALFLLGVLEGMPFMISFAAIYWKRKMLSNKASVPGLLDCVKMDSAATIFTDKTLFNSTAVTVCVIGCDDNLAIDQLHSGIVRNALCYGISTPFVVPGSRGDTATVEDPLLLWAASNLDMKLDQLRQRRTIMKTKRLNPDEEGSGVLMKITRMDGQEQHDVDVYAHWKGPATTMLGKSSSFLDKNGDVKSFDDDKRKSLETVIEDIERAGLQAVGFAYKQSQTLEEDGLTLIAILGLKSHTCCTQTMAELKSLTDAGVKIVLVSEDDALELKETATACGIFPQDGIAITGLDFQELDENQKMDKVDKISVMGNAAPSDRLSLMQWRKKKNDRIVAALGTHTIDTPLLKEADLSVAMGSWSSNTAKDSADIIVHDGTLTSLLAVVRCGRCTHLNIRKYVQVELVTNIAGTLIAAITTLSFGSTPVTGFQLIWVTFVMAVVAGPALLLEPPCGVPGPQSAPLISKTMWRNIVVQVSYQSGVLLGLAFGFRGKGCFVNKSVIFNAFVFCQLVNLVNSREIEKLNILTGVYRNPWLLATTVVVIVALQLCFVEVSSAVVDNAKLNLKQWGLCFLIGLGSCPVDFAAKCLSNFARAGPHSGETTMVHSSSTDSIENLELPLMSSENSSSASPQEYFQVSNI